MSAVPAPLPVIHVTDAHTGAGSGLWGKERLIEGLMLAQRDAGEIAPRLVCFSACSFADVVRDHGFPVHVLDGGRARNPLRALRSLGRYLAADARAVVHTHEYKANVIGRLARAAGSPMRGLLSTCHAWFELTPALRFYNELDRQTAFASDVTTVADAKMLAQFPKRGTQVFVANAIPDRMPPGAEERRAARQRFDFPVDRIVVGFLARTDASKGIPEVLEAARRTAGEPILWAIAGTGDLAGAIVDAALPNVRFAGYVDDSEGYRAAIDVYLQASHVEGLSLSLLEAMRAGLPIVATDAGSTERAVTDGREAVVIRAGDVDALVAAVRGLVADPGRRSALGRASRERFVAEFRIERQQREFLALYRECERLRAARRTAKAR